MKPMQPIAEADLPAAIVARLAPHRSRGVTLTDLAEGVGPDAELARLLLAAMGRAELSLNGSSARGIWAKFDTCFGSTPALSCLLRSSYTPDSIRDGKWSHSLIWCLPTSIALRRGQTPPSRRRSFPEGTKMPKRQSLRKRSASSEYTGERPSDGQVTTQPAFVPSSSSVTRSPSLASS